MKRTARISAALLATALFGSLNSGAAPAADAKAKADAKKDRVVVMYFHRTQRCPTCLKMGSYTEEAVKTGFAREIKQGKVAFHYIDFQDEKNAAYTKAYSVTGPTLIVAKASGAKVSEYKDLEEMWTKVREKPDFVEYVRSNVVAYLK